MSMLGYQGRVLFSIVTNGTLCLPGRILCVICNCLKSLSCVVAWNSRLGPPLWPTRDSFWLFRLHVMMQHGYAKEFFSAPVP